MSDPADAPRDPSPLAAILGVFSAGWALAIWLPLDLPAWPAASAGLIGLAVAWYPGNPLLRGLGGFLCAIGMLGGLAKIAALWGILELVQ